ncbi:PREDICTED: protein no-on-transient A-like [Acromyrmex echinatior]|uniref:protein no-on-transient A-like n=1 Tax=Acromyrmex echinatior TaxID=103372 RepID=UPI000580FE56|nr:PREDICTED: protein no-on-transient A-like [Acromyrmex echinatior]
MRIARVVAGAAKKKEAKKRNYARGGPPRRCRVDPPSGYALGHERASPRVFVKRDDAGGGGANRGGSGGDGGGGGGGGGDGSQGNDRKQLKGGESESRTSSTRQPHASSPPLLRPGPTKPVHLGQLASGRQEDPGSSTRTSLFSSRNRRIQCRRRRAIPNDYRRVACYSPKIVDNRILVPFDWIWALSFKYF